MAWIKRAAGVFRRQSKPMADVETCAWCDATVPAAGGLVMRDSRIGRVFVCDRCARG